jgi:hypothetical protein
MSRARQVAVALDSLVNAIFGGYAGETISARAYRLRTYQPYKTLQPVIDGLFFFQPNHCKSSYQAILDGAHLPDEYRQ